MENNQKMLAIFSSSSLEKRKASYSEKQNQEKQ